MKEITAAILGAIMAFWVSNQTLSDSLDTKSGWREKLFAVASKYELTLDDAQTVRTALRIFPNCEKVEQYSFTWFSNIMIVHMDKYILNRNRPVEQNSRNAILTYYEGAYRTPHRKANRACSLTKLSFKETAKLESEKLNSFDTEIVRLFAMFLLKYHFDYRSAMGAKDFIFLKKKDRSRKYKFIVKETYDRYEKLLQQESERKQRIDGEVEQTNKKSR
ncbi:TPA: hypothetical protein U1B43_000413 [Streptococcus suis]|uniref:hypothetical protein n=1 Tax=Streptococcus suis TaxID=1307 RepID=UPI002AA4331E|nr:hypothetical protein [Streptococcus suis]